MEFIFELCWGVTISVVEVMLISWARTHAQVEVEVGPQMYTNLPLGHVVPRVVENTEPSLTVNVRVVYRLISSGVWPVADVSVLERPALKSIRVLVDVEKIAVTAS